MYDNDIDYFEFTKELANFVEPGDWRLVGFRDKNDPRAKAAMNIWRCFIQMMKPHDRQITEQSCEPATYYFINMKWVDTPGRKMSDDSIINDRCSPETRYRWFSLIRKALHLYFDNTDKFDYRTNGFQYFSGWYDAFKTMSKSMPLYAKDDCKYWIGIIGLMRIFDDLFPPPNTFDSYFKWHELNEEQKVWMVDMFAYLAAARIVELLFSDSKKSRKQGLYFRQFAKRIYKDPFGGNLSTCHAALLYFNDYQKNDACATMSNINNRGIVPCRFKPEPAWKNHPIRKYFTISKFLSILFAYEISVEDTHIFIADPDSPVFPDLDKPLVKGKWHVNISASRAQTIRAGYYRRVFPAAPSMRFGGHVYRGARICEMLSLGVPPVAVAQISRHRNVSSLLHYLATNLLCLIGFSHLMPSNGFDKSEYSASAWFYANHRLFLEIGKQVLPKRKQQFPFYMCVSHAQHVP